MSPLRLLPCLTLALVVALSSCSTSEHPAPPSSVSSWYLPLDDASRESATLSRGMTQDEVLALLGRPWRKSKDKKSDGIHETWTYKRLIKGAPKISRTKYVTVVQPERLLDVVTIEFTEGILQTADVERRPEEQSDLHLSER